MQVSILSSLIQNQYTNTFVSVKCVGVHVGLIGLIITITQLNLNLVRNSSTISKKSLPTAVEKLLENKLVTTLLCLPAKFLQPKSGNLIDEDDEDDHVSSSANIQAIAGSKEVTNQVVISELIDRIVLLSYTLFLVFFHS